MTDAENLKKVGQNTMRRAEAIKAEIDRTGSRYAQPNPEIEPTVTEARNGADRAAKYAESISTGGVAMARLATDELIIALQQLSAAVHYAGGVVDYKLPDLPHHNSAGEVTVRSEAVADDGRTFVAASGFSAQTPYFFPGGSVAGMVVPRGWYSIPWWRDLAKRENTSNLGITLALGAVAHEFYDKVIARMPDKPSTTDWEKGIGTPPTVSGRSSAGGDIDDDTLLEKLLDVLFS